MTWRWRDVWGFQTSYSNSQMKRLLSLSIVGTWQFSRVSVPNAPRHKPPWPHANTVRVPFHFSCYNCDGSGTV